MAVAELNLCKHGDRYAPKYEADPSDIPAQDRLVRAFPHRDFRRRVSVAAGDPAHFSMKLNREDWWELGFYAFVTALVVLAWLILK